jgi:hypothetical protein
VTRVGGMGEKKRAVGNGLRREEPLLGLPPGLRGLIECALEPRALPIPGK